MRVCNTLCKLYTQGQYLGKYRYVFFSVTITFRFREYFYYINHEGYLFLDDARMKIFTAAYRGFIYHLFWFQSTFLRSNFFGFLLQKLANE